MDFWWTTLATVIGGLILYTLTKFIEIPDKKSFLTPYLIAFNNVFTVLMFTYFFITFIKKVSKFLENPYDLFLIIDTYMYGAILIAFMYHFIKFKIKAQVYSTATELLVEYLDAITTSDDTDSHNPQEATSD